MERAGGRGVGRERGGRREMGKTEPVEHPAGEAHSPGDEHSPGDDWQFYAWRVRACVASRNPLECVDVSSAFTIKKPRGPFDVLREFLVPSLVKIEVSHRPAPDHSRRCSDKCVTVK